VAKARAAEFQATFETLKKVLGPYTRKFDVIVDKPGRFYLASRTAKTSSGAAIWFGGVDIRKNYVSFHFIPVYAMPALVKTLSPSLKKRMQGKGCFNFTAIEPAHVKELKALTKTGYDGFIKKFR
jgi:hypothetical protein